MSAIRFPVIKRAIASTGHMYESKSRTRTCQGFGGLPFCPDCFYSHDSFAEAPAAYYISEQKRRYIRGKYNNSKYGQHFVKRFVISFEDIYTDKRNHQNKYENQAVYKNAAPFL